MAELSTVKKSELEGTMRLDAEYYQPKYFQNEDMVRASAFAKSTLADLIYPIRNGFDYRDFGEAGCPYIRVGDVLFGEVNYRDAVKVDISSDTIKKDVKIEEGDILFSRKGTFGRSAVVEDVFEDSIISSEIMRLRIKDERVDPYYLSTFLNSRIGFLQVERRTHGVSNYSISQPELRSVKIVIPPKELQLGVTNLVKEAHHENELSYDLYLQAEQLLLDEVGFKALDLSHQPHYTVPYRKVRQVSRVDAEHFQPKYGLLIQHLGKTGKTDLLGNRVTQPIRRGLQPTYVEDGEVIVVNSQHLGRYVLNIEATERTDRVFWRNNERCQLQRNDVLFYSTGAYIGRTNAWLEDQKAITSNHVTIIRPNATCNPLYLAVYLNSPLGLLQAECWASGSGQREIYPTDIAGFVVYLLSMEFQQRIADLVTQSWEARQKARQLLEEAKRKVEDLVMGKGTQGEGC